MIIYRPHRGLLADSMKEAKEFPDFYSMKKYIVEASTDEEFGAPFTESDIVVDDEEMPDVRNGWMDTRYVCIKRYYNEKYTHPACIGMCATKYKK